MPASDSETPSADAAATAESGPGARESGRDGCRPDPDDVTRLLQRAGEGDRAAFDRAVVLVHDELHLIAHRQLRRRWQDSLHTTGLLNEAFLKLVRGSHQEWRDRCHFFAIAATAMRRILIDRARRKLAEKRRCDHDALPLDDVQVGVSSDPVELLALDAALERLQQADSDLARVVECRFFGGLTFEEMAIALDRHERTLRRDWQRARAWLHRELAS